MKIQVLTATMHQTDHSLVEKMNIKSDAIIANQCDFNSVEKFNIGDQEIIYLNFAERGVGLNRNNALMRATADVCLFADDDMIYEDDYIKTLERAYAEFPDADVIIFNLIEKEPKRYIIKEPARVNKLNFLRYGAARVSFKLSSVRANGIYFNQDSNYVYSLELFTLKKCVFIHFFYSPLKYSVSFIHSRIFA